MLQPLDDRLPAEPPVKELVDDIGLHGGTWSRAALGTENIDPLP